MTFALGVLAPAEPAEGQEAAVAGRSHPSPECHTLAQSKGATPSSFCVARDPTHFPYSQTPQEAPPLCCLFPHSKLLNPLNRWGN